MKYMRNHEYQKYVNRFDEGYFEKNWRGGYSNYTNESAGFVNCWVDMIKQTPHMTVLDVGCAYGPVVKKLREDGIEAFGIDVSEWAISKKIDEHCFLYDGVHIPFPDRMFDNVVAFDVFEHVPYDVVVELLREMIRVSKKYIGLNITNTKDVDKTHISTDPEMWDFILTKVFKLKEVFKGNYNYTCYEIPEGEYENICDDSDI